MNMSCSSHQNGLRRIYTYFSWKWHEKTHEGALALTDDVEIKMKRCERESVSLLFYLRKKNRGCWISCLGFSLFVTHTLSHSLTSSFSLFHLSELMNRCCRTVECRMMDCASGGRSQLGKERERRAHFYDFSAIQTILTRKRQIHETVAPFLWAFMSRFKVQGFFICHIKNYTGYNQMWNVVKYMWRDKSEGTKVHVPSCIFEGTMHQNV